MTYTLGLCGDSAVDPGFPVGGGADPLRGHDLRHGHFSAETYAKTKKLGPVGRGRRWRPRDPPLILLFLLLWRYSLFRSTAEENEIKQKLKEFYSRAD